MRQTTLAGEVRVSGLGIHGGQPANLALRPAPADHGVVFVRTDIAGDHPPIPALATKVCDTRLATVVREGDGPTISTVEHIMAALAGLGVDNAVVEVDGPEIPIMDGCSGDFASAIDAVGVTKLAEPRRYIEIIQPIVIEQPGKRAALVPSHAPGAFEMSVEIVFDSLAIGRQQLDLAVDPASFKAEIASACTFGFLHEVDQLRAAGLGKGADLTNTIVVDGDHVMNPETLARPDDFVRHKALDALGDLALFGHPILGRYEASCSGHALNNALVRAALAQPEKWRLVTRANAAA